MQAESIARQEFSRPYGAEATKLQAQEVSCRGGEGCVGEVKGKYGSGVDVCIEEGGRSKGKLRRIEAIL